MEGKDDVLGVGVELPRRPADVTECEQRFEGVPGNLKCLADLLRGVSIEAEVGPEEMAAGPQPGDPLAILGAEPLDDLAHRKRG